MPRIAQWCIGIAVIAVMGLIGAAAIREQMKSGEEPESLS